MLPIHPEPTPKDWVRQVVREYCSYEVKHDYIKQDGTKITLYSAHGIVWPNVLKMLEMNCRIEYLDIVEVFEKCEGREHSRLMLLVYGALKDAAIRQSGLWVPYEDNHKWLDTVDILQPNRKRGANILRKYKGS